jgi:hypothetical protein
MCERCRGFEVRHIADIGFWANFEFKATLVGISSSRIVVFEWLKVVSRLSN